MASQAELGILLTARDLASGVMRGLAGVLTGELAGALSSAARAGADHEASLIRLETAANNTALGYEYMALALGAASDQGKAFGFGTVEINDSLALLIEQTGNSQDAMDRLYVAEELAHGAHIDLYTASKLLGKATNDNVDVLGRYGVHVKNNMDVTEMLAAVQSKFGGQAEAYGDSTAGAIDKTTNAIKDWQAKIGDSLGPAQQYIALLDPGMTAGLSTMMGALGSSSLALKFFGVSTAASLGPILAVIGALALVVVAFVQVYDTIMFVKDNWDKFVSALKSGKLDDIPVFGFFFHAAKDVISALGHIKDLWDAVSGAFSGNGGAAAAAAAVDDSAVPAYASGTSFVPRTGLAVLHRGEAVIPAGQNGGGGGTTVNFSFAGANIYGQADFEDAVAKAVLRVKQGGGFRGTLV